MTNAQIILCEQIRLNEEGRLRMVGRKLVTLEGSDDVIEIPEFQPIHTYATWKSMGYQVKKGEKAIAKFPIWKFCKCKKEVDVPEDDKQIGTNSSTQGKMFMKTAAFFTDEQVERIEEKDVVIA